MKYLTVKETAEKWNLSVRCIQNYCMSEKIPGARLIGKQWMIPSDAEMPSDGRTKTAKSKAPNLLYRFPLLVYTPYYSDSSELSYAEHELLRAQIMHFEGKFSEGITICSALLKQNLPNHILIGAYFTIGFNAALSGLHLEYKNAVEKIKVLIEKEDRHKEDMKLLLATLIFHTSWEFDGFLKINPELLSQDALPLYKYNFVTKNILSGSINDEIIYHYIQSDLAQIHTSGILPLELTYRCLLGNGNYAVTHSEICEHHLSIAVKISVEQGWLSKLSKFYAFNMDVIDRLLSEYGKHTLVSLKEFRATTSRNWQLTHAVETGVTIGPDMTDERLEYMVLATYNLSYEQIATIKQLPVSEIKAIYKELFELFGVENKRELMKYAFDLFKSLMPNVSGK